MSADAFHITAPSEDGDGGMRVMASALDDAGVAPAEVDYINAHGTSTPYNDKLETLAIRRLFGEHAAKLAISSTKSMTGHLLGAAGGLEAGITALAIKHQLVPPTINYQTPDPECDLDYVPNTARPMAITLRPVELVRLRRHQRGAAVQEVRRMTQLPTSNFQLPRGVRRAAECRRCNEPMPDGFDPVRSIDSALGVGSWKLGIDSAAMKIAVCIKQVVTREWQLRVNDQKTWIRDADASFELNEPDAYALEEALRLKEKQGGEVVVCCAGPARATQVIREALARGADRAIHVESRRAGARPMRRPSPMRSPRRSATSSSTSC